MTAAAHRRVAQAAALLAAAALCSALMFAPLHAGHDCPGDGCPVCMVMQAVRTCLQTLTGATMQTAALLFSLPCAYALGAAALCMAAIRTPVTQKVRLNN